MKQLVKDIINANGKEIAIYTYDFVNEFISLTDIAKYKSNEPNDVDPELDAEALRIVKGMPKWTPGTQNGKPVNVKYTLPVNFSLQKNATSEKKK